MHSDELKNELKAIENIVLEYEKVNRNVDGRNIERRDLKIEHSSIPTWKPV